MSSTASYERQPASPASPATKVQIALLDHTITHDCSANASDHETDTEQSDSEHPTPVQRTLSKKLTNTSLQGSVRRAIERQKYARYQSYRYGPSLDAQLEDDHGDNEEHRQPDLLERGRARAAAIWRGKKRLAKEEERDSVVDILYENQRGSFFFGIPRYSSNSLLQFDAKPWQNADFRTSAVDIRNAQVPDPSWEWSWTCWYVDMNRDVDEQGWEYSFAFGNQFAWHGNHPWFHSFVRRRRWLRKRARKDKPRKTKERGHELAPDYFTIHTKVLSAASQSQVKPSDLVDTVDLDDPDITDAGALSQHMRAARLDREKLVAMRACMKSGSTDDIQYLAHQMSGIMSLFIYQSSRRQLLAELVQQHEEASKRQEELSQHDHSGDDLQAKHAEEQKRADVILEAVKAADDQIQKLEYWSDIREIAKSESLSKDKAVDWDAKRWQGLKSAVTAKAFSSKQDVDAPAAALHDKPEEQKKKDESETDSSAYTTAPSLAPGSKPPPVVKEKRPSVVLRKSETDNSLERFVTASEGPVSSIKPRQYSSKTGDRAATLDGVEEGSEVPTAEELSDEQFDEESPLHEVNAEDSRVEEP